MNHFTFNDMLKPQTSKPTWNYCIGIDNDGKVTDWFTDPKGKRHEATKRLKRKMLKTK